MKSSRNSVSVYTSLYFFRKVVFLKETTTKRLVSNANGILRYNFQFRGCYCFLYSGAGQALDVACRCPYG